MFYQRLTGLTLALLAILFAAGGATAAQDRALKPGESVEIELRASQSQNFKLALSPLDYARLSVNPRYQEITVKIVAPAVELVALVSFPLSIAFGVFDV